MFLFALLLLFNSGSRVGLVDEVYQLPAHDWRYIEFALHQQTAEVAASFSVLSGAPKVQLALMSREDIEHLRNDAPQNVLAVTPPGASGRLRFHVRQPGNYVVVLDNHGAPAASVRLRVTLDFVPAGPNVTELSPRRQLAVIAISFAVFFGIVSWSARKLLKGVRHGPSRA